jgi:hypothetical protein
VSKAEFGPDRSNLAGNGWRPCDDYKSSSTATGSIPLQVASGNGAPRLGNGPLAMAHFSASAKLFTHSALSASLCFRFTEDGCSVK